MSILIRGLFAAGVACAAMLFAGCREEVKYFSADSEKTVEESEPAATLSGERLRAGVFGVTHLDCADSLLVLTTMNDTSYFDVIDPKRDTVVAGFGCLGNGGKEFQRQPATSYVCVENGRAFLYASEGFTTKSIDLSASVRSGKQETADVLLPEKYDMFTTDYFFNRKKVVSYKTVSYEDARDEVYHVPEVRVFGEGDGSGKKVRMYTEMVSPKDKNTLVNTCYFVVCDLSPSASQFVVAHSAMDLFFIVDVATGQSLSVRTDGAYSFSDVVEMNTVAESQKKMRIFYTDVCVTDHYVVLLQDGRPASADRDIDLSSYLPTVKFYDFDGNPIVSVQCRESLQHITFDEATSTLYATDSEDGLYRYNLREFLDAK